MTNFPERLISGYRAFRSGDFLNEKERLETLSDKGQKPETMLIACCDSRSAPEMIFNAHPGELFVIRNVANLVPANNPDLGFHSVSAAVEFAVLGLGVTNIVVMGHAKCGGISAALNPDMEPLSPGNFIGDWIELLKPTAAGLIENAQMTQEQRQDVLEKRSVQVSVNNLRTYPFISTLEEEGKLALYGAWFDIAKGQLWTMDNASGDFTPA